MPGYVCGNHAAAGGASSLTIALPLDAAVGDRAILLARSDDTTVPLVTPDLLSGWTQLAVSGGSDPIPWRLQTRLLASTGNITQTYTGGSAGLNGLVVVLKSNIGAGECDYTDFQASGYLTAQSTLPHPAVTIPDVSAGVLVMWVTGTNPFSTIDTNPLYEERVRSLATDTCGWRSYEGYARAATITPQAGVLTTALDTCDGNFFSFAYTDGETTNAERIYPTVNTVEIVAGVHGGGLSLF
jgi:hypothetical protein